MSKLSRDFFQTHTYVAGSSPFGPSCRFATEVGPARGDNICRVARQPLSNHKSCYLSSSGKGRPNDLTEM